MHASRPICFAIRRDERIALRAWLPGAARRLKTRLIKNKVLTTMAPAYGVKLPRYRRVDVAGRLISRLIIDSFYRYRTEDCLSRRKIGRLLLRKCRPISSQIGGVSLERREVTHEYEHCIHAFRSIPLQSCGRFVWLVGCRVQRGQDEASSDQICLRFQMNWILPYIHKVYSSL
jgi:hypothetical protein